jgi:putative DNA primase/helicase
MSTEYISLNGFDHNAEEWSAFDPERLITVTKFPDRYALSKTELTLPFPEGLVQLIETETASSKARLPLLKLGAFSGVPTGAGCLRYDAGMLRLSGGEAEHDAGKVSIAEVVLRLQRARLKALVYPSPSHTPEKPKWRVLTPYARDFAGDEAMLREYRNKMLNRLNGVLDGMLTGECWALSQIFYFGGVGKLIKATIVEGDWVDERDDLDAGRSVTNHGSRNGKQPLGDDEGDDNPSNVTKAQTLLRNVVDLHDNRFNNIACPLRRDIGLTHDKSVELIIAEHDRRGEPYDLKKIEDCCHNAGDYGHGDQGVYAGAGADAYSTEVIRNSAPRQKVRFKTGKPRKVIWLWRDWLPQGKLTLIAGRPGDGKSMITLALAAAFTTRGKWPDGTECGKPGDVLIWSSEDDWNDTIQPRFLAAGGDINRIHCIDAVEGPDGSVRPFNPATDMALLEDAVEQFPETKLAIIDPIIVIAPGKAGDTADIRLKMVPMVSLAERRQIAVLGVTHFAKGTQEMDLLERFIGSQAWGAAARCAWITVKSEETGKRRLIRVKSSLGPEGDGFDFRMEGADVPGYPEVGERHVVKWLDGVVRGSARKLFCEISGTSEGSKIQLARAFILEKVPTTGMNSTWLIEAANDAGHAPKTVRAAKTELVKENLLHSAPGEDGKWWVYRTAYEPKPAS